MIDLFYEIFKSGHLIITIGLFIDIIGAAMIIKPMWNIIKLKSDLSEAEKNLPIKEFWDLILEAYKQHWVRRGFILLIIGFMLQLIGNWIQMGFALGIYK